MNKSQVVFESSEPAINVYFDSHFDKIRFDSLTFTYADEDNNKPQVPDNAGYIDVLENRIKTLEAANDYLVDAMKNGLHPEEIGMGEGDESTPGQILAQRDERVASEALYHLHRLLGERGEWETAYRTLLAVEDVESIFAERTLCIQTSEYVDNYFAETEDEEKAIGEEEEDWVAVLGAMAEAKKALDALFQEMDATDDD